MSTKKLAIFVSHGMGEQKKSNPDATSSPVYSKALKDKVRNKLGHDVFDANIAWHEAFWADIYQPRQTAYLERCFRLNYRFGFLRKFIKNRISDAASYAPSRNNSSSYQKIHDRFDTALMNLEKDCDPNAEVLFLTHSLGSHILSNYIYDVQEKKRPTGKPDVAFDELTRFRGMITFGANLPVFVYALDPIVPISYPGSKKKTKAPWWLNYFKSTDSLGYPLAPLGGAYQNLVNAGEIKDHQEKTLMPFPWSHNSYWKDDRLVNEIVGFIKRK